MKAEESKYTGYNSNLKELARNLRKNMTPQEKKLWYTFLRNHPVKFYRQRPIDRYIADFFCYSAKLVIELDGSQHYTPEGIEYDTARTEIINAYGIEVIRFSNLEIDRHFKDICNAIDMKLKERLKSNAPS